MNKFMLVFALLFAGANVAQAGFFDSLFGGSSEEAEAESATVVEAKATAPATTNNTSANTDMGSVATSAMALLPMLTDQLGVTSSQAEGGMGSLMGLAKSSLSSDEFGQLSDGIPGMETLLAAAPALTGKSSSGGMSGMLSNVGGMAASLGGLQQVTQQFEALGLSPDMIAQFANIAISYLSQSSEGTADLLQKGLSAVLG